MALSGGDPVDAAMDRLPKASRRADDSTEAAAAIRAAPSHPVAEGTADRAARWFEQLDLQTHYASQHLMANENKWF